MSASPEEKALIKAAMKWQRNATADTVGALIIAAQAVRISRRPIEGPEPIPCMERSRYSREMFCHLPKGHDGSAPVCWSDTTWGYSYHEGVAPRGNGVRRFQVAHRLVDGVWQREEWESGR